MRVRLWMLALVCVGCGVIGHVALRALAPPDSRGQGWAQFQIQVLWYVAALLLWLIHLWRIGTSGRPAAEVPSCGMALLLVVGAVLAFFVAVWSSVPGE